MGQLLVLVGISTPRPLSRVVPADRPRLLGRSSQCDLVIDHPSVSRRHAELEVYPGGIRVTDVGSSNGTFVESRRVTQATIDPGQQVRFGGLEFMVSTNEEGVAELDSCIETEEPAPSDHRGEPPTPPVCLSQAQQRVFDLMVDGMAEKAIAKRLGISRHTVHNHIRVVYSLFGVHSRPELLARIFSPQGTVSCPRVAPDHP
jgi:pSer/pThr/pTyr-binding forkhead associated (FHA) protein